MSCFLSKVSECEFRPDGKPDRAHLIPLQRIKKNRIPVPEEEWWSPEVIVPLCRKHHHQFDVAKTIRLSRKDLSRTGVEAWAVRNGMVWSLERDYE